MISWTVGQWICYSIVWLWGTFLSGKLSGVLEGFFEAKVLAIYPYYKISKRHGGFPAWLVGAAGVWILPITARGVKSYINLDPGLIGEVFVDCVFSLIIILPLTYLGWLLSNYFRMAGTVADASALRWKSMKPYEHD
jgi:hypothetical protein